jgi:hypothetical protein
MISTEDIAEDVYRILKSSTVSGNISGSISYFRYDYTKEDIIIVPHTMIGSSSLRHGQININIHVPDQKMIINNKETYVPNQTKLKALKKEVATILKKHYDGNKGYSWTVEAMDPAIKEQNHNEHFMCVKLELVVRKKEV